MITKEDLYKRVKVITHKKRVKDEVTVELNKLKIEIRDEFLKTKYKIKSVNS